MTLESVSRTWQAARAIIAQALAEIDRTGNVPVEVCQRNAEAIIARLASAEPPLLICTSDEMREEKP